MKITLHKLFGSYLKPHQFEAIQFCIEHMLQRKGCILAHYMGLGKTLTALVFMHCCLTDPIIKSERILLIVPKSLIENWVEEHKYWVKNELVENPFTLHVIRSKKDVYREVHNWHNNTNCVLVCTPHRLTTFFKFVCK